MPTTAKRGLVKKSQDTIVTLNAQYFHFALQLSSKTVWTSSISFRSSFDVTTCSYPITTDQTITTRWIADGINHFSLSSLLLLVLYKRNRPTPIGIIVPRLLILIQFNWLFSGFNFFSPTPSTKNDCFVFRQKIHVSTFVHTIGVWNREQCLEFDP